MPPEKTKDKLLNAAVSVFAEKSYSEATVAEICERAEANISAVNYHFGSKEKLLRHALRHAFQMAESEHPLGGDLKPGATPEARLFAYLNAMIRRSFDPGSAGLFERIMSREGTREVHGNITFDEVSQLQGKYLTQILNELLVNPDAHLLQQARLNLIALCVFPNLAPQLVNLLFPKKPTESELVTYIEHQFQFARRGLAVLKSSI